VPQSFFKLTTDIPQLIKQAKNWLDLNDPESDGFYFENFAPLLSWISDRELGSSHLLNGPHLYFFKHAETMRVIWDTDTTPEIGPFWTAKSGYMDFAAETFEASIEAFGQAFFDGMQSRVNKALKRDWGAVHLDKTKLQADHDQRVERWNRLLTQMKVGNGQEADWELIQAKLDMMQS